MPCYDDRSHDCSEAYAARDRATRVACELAKLLTSHQRAALTKGSAKWIAEHEEMDGNREKCERERRERELKKNKLLSKLSAEEKKILGL